MVHNELKGSNTMDNEAIIDECEIETDILDYDWKSREKILMTNKDIFYFDYGCVVFWGLTIQEEKIAIKDAKLRTFITNDDDRNDMVAHVYDITYGTIRKGIDNLVVIDDSIVRGTTLKNSILRMLDRLGPKKIIVVSIQSLSCF